MSSEAGDSRIGDLHQIIFEADHAVVCLTRTALEPDPCSSLAFETVCTFNHIFPEDSVEELLVRRVHVESALQTV